MVWAIVKSKHRRMDSWVWYYLIGSSAVVWFAYQWFLHLYTYNICMSHSNQETLNKLITLFFFFQFFQIESPYQHHTSFPSFFLSLSLLSHLSSRFIKYMQPSCLLPLLTHAFDIQHGTSICWETFWKYRFIQKEKKFWSKDENWSWFNYIRVYLKKNRIIYFVYILYIKMSDVLIYISMKHIIIYKLCNTDKYLLMY